LNAGIPDDIHVKVKVDTSQLAQAQQSVTKTTNMVQELGKASFQTARGLLTLGAPVAVHGLLQLAEVGTAATQALWLLPAAASAAAAGIGTLAIATHGFGDAIKDMGDPKKFAEALATLAPNAQQAALQIKNLVDGPLGDLKRMTQDTFFAGMSEQINRLVTTYLPALQSMTTSIAGSFNQMMNGVANQLMTPQMQASLTTMFTNISTMFQNLAPAMAPIVQAFTDIATVGSGFLPGLASGITNAANSFATFINNARESGQLQVWIQQGIDAVKNLGAAAWELIQIWYRVFGPEMQASTDSSIVGVHALKETVQSYGADLEKISDIIGILAIDTQTWSRIWNQEMVAMQGPLGALRDGILDIPEAMAFATNKIIDGLNWAKHGVENFAETATNMVNILLPDSMHKTFEKLPDIGHVPSGGDWGGYQDTRGPFGNDQTGGQTPLGGGPNAQRQRRGLPPIGIGAPPPPGSPFAVPGVPPDAGSKPSDRERRDAIIAGLDPSLWRVDPNAPVPGLPSAGPLAGGPMPDGGYGAASGQEFFEGQQKIVAEAHDLEEARKDRLALERDNESTAEQINDAKWKEYEAGVQLQKAQADLVEKTRGTTQQAKQGMDELGAALDPDLGLSKGLSGLADNLVRFIGSLAAAPLMGQLNAIKNQNEAATGIQGGYGILGIHGAQNLSKGLSPLLGNPLPTDTSSSGTTGGAGLNSPTSYTPTSSTTGSLNTSSLPMPSNLKDTGSVPSSAQSRTAAAFIEQMFPGVIRGPIGGSRDKNTAKGTHDAGLSIDIPIDSDQMGIGDQINAALQANAQALGLKYTIWRNQGKYPGGGGFSADGHMDHIDAHFNGQGGGGGPLGMPAGMSSGAMPGPGSGVVPVYVTNMGGGGMGLPGLGGGGLPGGTGGGAPGTPTSPTTGGVPGQGAESWRGVVGQVFDQYAAKVGIPANTKQQWVNAIVKQIDTESKGNPMADNPNDSNGQGGKQHVSGLLQYLPETYANSGGKLTGRPYMDPIGQIAGALLASRNPDGTPAGIGKGSGWGPSFNLASSEKPLPYPGTTPGTATPGGNDFAPYPGTTPGTATPGGNPIGVGGALGLNPATGAPPTKNGGPGGIPTAPTVGGAPHSIPTAPTTGGVPTTPYGGVEPYSNPAGGGIGVDSGMASMVGSGLDMMMPGAGQAASTGMKLIGRGIQYAGQMGGLAVDAAMQTFLPTGGSELANNSWLTRIVGGLAGASAAIPNLAGGKGGQPPGALTPQQVQQNQQPGLGGALGNTVNVEYNNNGATEDRAGNDLAYHLSQQNNNQAVAGTR
jgi:hypothetical protein